MEFRIHGSGLLNEDEVKDFQSQVKLEQEAQRKREREMQEWLEQQRRIKEEAEQARLQQIEREKAITERAEARIRLRKHYAHLQEVKRLESEQRILREKAEEEQRLRRLAQQEQERMEQRRLAEMTEDIRRENELMAAEDSAQRELIRHLHEIAKMEHEDILSCVYSKLLEQEAQQRREIEEMCSLVYEPFIPFQFKSSRAHPSRANDELTETDRQNTLNVSELSREDDLLSMTITAKNLASASFMTIVNERPKTGQQTFVKVGDSDLSYFDQLKNALPTVGTLFSMPQDFEADYFYLEACRPGLRSAGIIERPPSPTTLISIGGYSASRLHSPAKLPPLFTPSKMHSNIRRPSSIAGDPQAPQNLNKKDLHEKKMGIRGSSKPFSKRLEKIRAKSSPKNMGSLAPLESLNDSVTTADSSS